MQQQKRELTPNLLIVISELKEPLLSLTFNILTYEDEVEKQQIAWTILQQQDYYEGLEKKVDKSVVCQFLESVYLKYGKNKNSFHNFDHAIAVMQCQYSILSNSKLAKMISPLEQFSMVLAALCHDMSHSGKSNIFECNSYSKHAIRYNDKSVLENMHSSKTFKLLMKASTNIIPSLSLQQFSILRKTIIACILATDNAEHFSIMS